MPSDPWYSGAVVRNATVEKLKAAKQIRPMNDGRGGWGAVT